jgi:hypothetical protein
MMDESKQTDNQSLARDSGKEFAARRRVVKGMASAVPVVMTIGCGQAMAQASSFQCIVEPIVQPDHCINENAYDDYVREPATQAECNDTNPGGRNLLSKGSRSGMGEQKPGSSIFSKGSRGLSGTQPRQNVDNKKRLIYVDQDGNPTSSSGGNPVTLSCYASFIDTSSPNSAFGKWTSNKGRRG